jgi:DNA repair protein RadA/Sms
VLPESARSETGGDSGLVLNTVGGLTNLVAEIAARGNPRGKRQANPDENREHLPEKEHLSEKNATPARFRREGR